MHLCCTFKNHLIFSLTFLYVCFGVYTYVCTLTGGWRSVSISIFHLSVWDIVSHRTGNLSVLPDYLDKDLARPRFPVLMVQVCTTVPDFTCLPGNWTQLLLLAKQTLYLLSNLSSTQFCFCVGDILLFVFFLEEVPGKRRKPIRTRARRFLNPAAVCVHTLCQPSRWLVGMDAEWRERGCKPQAIYNCHSCLEKGQHCLCECASILL